MTSTERYAKQVIVVRKDLKMNHGKMAAQVAHASLGAVLKLFSSQQYNSGFGKRARILSTYLEEDTSQDAWLSGAFTKVCLKVDSEEELICVHANCVEAGIQPLALIQDAGKTTFHGVSTYTCLGIGPLWSDELEKLVGHLKLY